MKTLKSRLLVFPLLIGMFCACAKVGKTLGDVGILNEKGVNVFRSIDKGIKSFLPIGFKEEQIIGGALAIETVKRFGGLYGDENTMRYVNFVGRSVARISDRPNIRYFFAVLNTMEPNAFAAPGGYVFITRGVLALAKNEAELAGVLAHEIAHITQRHMLKTLRRSRLLSSVAEVTASALGTDPAMLDSLMKEANDNFFNKGFDKSMEYEADELGMEYAYRLGYNASGLLSFMQKLEKRLGKEPSIFFQTHPSISQRIERGKKQLRENYPNGKYYPLLAARYQKLAIF